MCQDHILKFYSTQFDLERIISQISDLGADFIRQMKTQNNKVVARLIAKVNFSHMNWNTNEETNRSYHFPSYSAEEVVEPLEDFFDRHLLKIASRLDSFHTNGSNLVIKNIECIFIQLSVVNNCHSNAKVAREKSCKMKSVCSQ